MQKMEIEEIRNSQLNILEYIDKICEKYNLNYYLACGTLLGAVRHKGFIPWDDDADIYMPLKDYEKFIKIVNKDKSDFKVLNPYDTNGYYYTFSKIIDLNTKLTEKNFKPIEDMGVFVDVFPLYNIPNEQSDLQKIYNKMNKLEKKLFRNYGFKKYYESSNSIKKIIKMILLFPEHIFYMGERGRKKIIKKVINCFNLYNNQSTLKIGNIVKPACIKEIYNRDLFNEYIVMKFEHLNLRVPKEYDKCLKLLYGNYLEFPPKEEQVNPHSFDAFKKEKKNGKKKH